MPDPRYAADDPTVEPRYKHDGCDHCVFIGRYEGVDIWHCTQGGALPTIIARRSDDPPDYESGPIVRIGDLEMRVVSRT